MTHAFDSNMWEAEAGRLGAEVNLECYSLRQGFPFGLASLVQAEWLASQLWESLVSIYVVLGFADKTTVPGFGAKLRTLGFPGKHFDSGATSPSQRRKTLQLESVLWCQRVTRNSTLKLISYSFLARMVCKGSSACL